METFKVSSIFSFCHCISKASDKSHGSVIVVYIYFILHFSRPFHNRNILLNTSVSFGAVWLAHASLLFQFDCPEKQLNTNTSVCCFLPLLVLSYELLTHCFYVNLCRSMKKSFQDKKEASV